MKMVEILLFIAMCGIIIGMIIILIILNKSCDRSYNERIARNLLKTKNNRIKTKCLYSLMKRWLDINVGLWSTLLLLPIIILLAGAIKLSGSKCVFRRYECIGKNRKYIHYYKMNAGPSSETKTHLGYIIYKLGLDTLPMLFSVFKGDLTTIGLSKINPSRQIEKNVEEMFKYEKPGLISVSSLIHIEGYTANEIDMLYIRRRNLSFDLQILLWAYFHKSTEIPIID